MKKIEYDTFLVGVGGQGNILASTILSNAALQQGLEVKKAETHGMAQRGGSVVSPIRISSSKVYSPLIPEGEVDLLLVFEPLEGLRYLDYLGPKSEIIVNQNPIKVENYPSLERINEIFKEEGALVIDALKEAKKAGHPLTQNIVLLGAASKKMPIEEKILKDTIRKSVKKLVDENIEAFELGRNLI